MCLLKSQCFKHLTFLNIIKDLSTSNTGEVIWEALLAGLDSVVDDQDPGPGILEVR